ncbi:MAG: hypothetical protein U0794_00490 [Isosphaeraceae bacterium]
MSPACSSCGALPGSFHSQGCSVERCPRCGGQSISCNCVYEFCGLDPDKLETDYPEIFEGGPTDEMYARWDLEWAERRLPWTGEWPGVAECREFGWYARLFQGKGWVRCGKDDPEATEDLNRLRSEAVWDVGKQRFVLRRSA